MSSLMPSAPDASAGAGLASSTTIRLRHPSTICLKQLGQGYRDIPIGEMFFHLSQVAVVADVIADAVF